MCYGKQNLLVHVWFAPLTIYKDTTCQYPHLKAEGLPLASTAVLHTVAGVQLWLLLPRHLEFRGDSLFHMHSIAKEACKNKCSGESTRGKENTSADAFLSSHRLKTGGSPERFLYE